MHASTFFLPLCFHTYQYNMYVHAIINYSQMLKNKNSAICQKFIIIFISSIYANKTKYIVILGAVQDFFLYKKRS